MNQLSNNVDSTKFSADELLGFAAEITELKAQLDDWGVAEPGIKNASLKLGMTLYRLSMKMKTDAQKIANKNYHLLQTNETLQAELLKDIAAFRDKTQGRGLPQDVLNGLAQMDSWSIRDLDMVQPLSVTLEDFSDAPAPEQTVDIPLDLGGFEAPLSASEPKDTPEARTIVLGQLDRVIQSAEAFITKIPNANKADDLSEKLEKAKALNELMLRENEADLSEIAAWRAEVQDLLDGSLGLITTESAAQAARTRDLIERNVLGNVETDYQNLLSSLSKYQQLQAIENPQYVAEVAALKPELETAFRSLENKVIANEVVASVTDRVANILYASATGPQMIAGLKVAAEADAQLKKNLEGARNRKEKSRAWALLSKTHANAITARGQLLESTDYIDYYEGRKDLGKKYKQALGKQKMALAALATAGKTAAAAPTPQTAPILGTVGNMIDHLAAKPEFSPEADEQILPEMGYTGPARLVPEVPGMISALSAPVDPVQYTYERMLAGIDHARMLVRTLAHENYPQAAQLGETLESEYTAVQNTLPFPADKVEAAEKLFTNAGGLAGIYKTLSEEVKTVFSGDHEMQDDLMVFVADGNRAYGLLPEELDQITASADTLEDIYADMGSLYADVYHDIDSVTAIKEYLVDASLYGIALEKQTADPSFTASLDDINAAWTRLNLSPAQMVDLANSFVAIGKFPGEATRNELALAAFDAVMSEAQKDTPDLTVDTQVIDALGTVETKQDVVDALQDMNGKMTLRSLLALGGILNQTPSLTPDEATIERVVTPAAEEAVLSDEVSEQIDADIKAALAADGIGSEETAPESGEVADLAVPEAIDLPKNIQEARLALADSFDTLIAASRPMAETLDAKAAETALLKLDQSAGMGEILRRSNHKPDSLADLASARNSVEIIIASVFDPIREGTIARSSKSTNPAILSNARAFAAAYKDMRDDLYIFNQFQGREHEGLSTLVEGLKPELVATLHTLTRGDLSDEIAGNVVSQIADQVYGNAKAVEIATALKLAEEIPSNATNRVTRKNPAASARAALLKLANDYDYYIDRNKTEKAKDVLRRQYGVFDTLAAIGAAELAKPAITPEEIQAKELAAQTDIPENHLPKGFRAALERIKARFKKPVREQIEPSLGTPDALALAAGAETATRIEPALSVLDQPFDGPLPLFLRSGREMREPTFDATPPLPAATDVETAPGFEPLILGRPLTLDHSIPENYIPLGAANREAADADKAANDTGEEAPLTLELDRDRDRFFGGPRKGDKIAATCAAIVMGAGKTGSFVLSALKVIKRRAVVIGVGSGLGFGARYGLGAGMGALGFAGATFVGAPIVALGVLAVGGAATVALGAGVGMFNARLNTVFDEKTAKGKNGLSATWSAFGQTIREIKSGEFKQHTKENLKNFLPVIAQAYRNVKTQDREIEHTTVRRAFNFSTRYLRTLGEASRLDSAAVRTGMNTMFGAAGSGVAFIATHMHLIDVLTVGPHNAVDAPALVAQPGVTPTQELPQVDRTLRGDSLLPGRVPGSETGTGVVADPNAGTVTTTTDPVVTTPRVGAGTTTTTDPVVTAPRVGAGTTTTADPVVTTPRVGTGTATTADPAVTTPRVGTGTTPTAMPPAIAETIAAATNDPDRVRALMQLPEMRAAIASLSPAQQQHFAPLIRAATNRGSFTALNDLINNVSEGGRFSGNAFTHIRGLRPDYAHATTLRQLIHDKLNGVTFENANYTRAVTINEDHLLALQGKPSRVTEWVASHPRPRPTVTPAHRAAVTGTGTATVTPTVTPQAGPVVSSAAVPNGIDPIGDLIQRVAPADVAAVPAETGAHHTIGGAIDGAVDRVRGLFRGATQPADTTIRTVDIPASHNAWTSDFSNTMGNRFLTNGMNREQFESLLTGIDNNNPGAIRALKSWTRTFANEPDLTRHERELMTQIRNMRVPAAAPVPRR